MENEKNTFLEISGQVKGVVVHEDKNMFFIRKGLLRSETEFTATPEVVCVKKELLNEYWIKLIERPYVIEPIDFISSFQLINEFFNV